MTRYPLELRSQVCANGETVEWWLTVAGDGMRVGTVWITEKVTPAEALARVLARATR